jgi:hypothetical protein
MNFHFNIPITNCILLYTFLICLFLWWKCVYDNFPTSVIICTEYYLKTYIKIDYINFHLLIIMFRKILMHTYTSNTKRFIILFIYNLRVWQRGLSMPIWPDHFFDHWMDEWMGGWMDGGIKVGEIKSPHMGPDRA